MIITKAVAGLALLGLLIAVPGIAHAQYGLVTNGGFEELSNGTGQLGYNTNATGWSVVAPPSSYTFAFSPSTVTTTGSPGQYGNLALYGVTASQDGGNFIGMDGDFQVGAISQTINGLTVGKSYTLSFDWAAAQQQGFSGATTEQWNVSLGGVTQSTAVLNDASHGFSGWQNQTFTYTATSTSEVLSFIAAGTPAGVPPFALLDGVSLVATPEPASLGMMVAGFMGIGVFGLFSRLRSSRSAKSVS